jgi:hypothetical protein
MKLRTSCTVTRTISGGRLVLILRAMLGSPAESDVMDCLKSGYQYRLRASRLFSISTAISLTEAAAEVFKALRLGFNVMVQMNRMA